MTRAARRGPRPRQSSTRCSATCWPVRPTPQLLQVLRGISPEPDDDSLLAASWQMLAVAASRADLEQLREEYDALFIGLGRGEVVPYGSWYLTGFLMEQPLAQLRGDLRELGIERQAGVHEPEDHAAALCDTMALLITGDEPGIARAAASISLPGTSSPGCRDSSATCSRRSRRVSTGPSGNWANSSSASSRRRSGFRSRPPAPRHPHEEARP